MSAVPLSSKWCVGAETLGSADAEIRVILSTDKPMLFNVPSLRPGPCQNRALPALPAARSSAVLCDCIAAALSSHNLHGYGLAEGDIA